MITATIFPQLVTVKSDDFDDFQAKLEEVKALGFVEAGRAIKATGMYSQDFWKLPDSVPGIEEGDGENAGGGDESAESGDTPVDGGAEGGDAPAEGGEGEGAGN